MFTLIAHRGHSIAAPENTFAAFDLALEQGFENFELDVQISREGIPVVFHDSTLTRTTGASGGVHDYTLAELKGMDAGNHFPDLPASESTKIPTLAEVLERYQGRAHIHLELKSLDPRVAELTAEELRRAGWIDMLDAEPYAVPGLTITSFFAQQLRRSTMILGERSHGWLVRRIDTAVIELAERIGCSGLYPNAETVTQEEVQLATGNGYVIRGWGIGGLENEAFLENVYRSGATGTTVDWPDKARSLIESWH